MEFLVNIKLRWSADLDEPAKTRIVTEERARAAELAASGHLVRIWRVPCQFENWGLWRVADATELHAIITSLPAYPWMETITTVPLAAHPADPGPTAQGPIFRTEIRKDEGHT